MTNFIVVYGGIGGVSKIHVKRRNINIILFKCIWIKGVEFIHKRNSTHIIGNS